MDHHQNGSRQPVSSTKVERKIVEKNRRSHMKNLYSKLHSILPNYDPKEVVALPDQIDEAINYIKSLETNVKRAQEKKERLIMGRKRIHSSGCCSSAFEAQGSLKQPKIEIHEMGFSLEVILTCGVENQFIFCEIIRILHQENVEVITVTSSMVGDSVLHVMRGEVRQSNLGATKVSEKLKRFVNGSVSDVEIEHYGLWDFEIGTTEMWRLLDPTLESCLPLIPL